MNKPHFDQRGNDKKLNQGLQLEVGTLRGGIMAQAMKSPLPARFKVERDKDRPIHHITDMETGNKTAVSLFAYKSVRNALNDLFPETA